MNMPDIDKVMKRTERYVYEDGIGEIFAGFLFVLIGLLFFVEVHLNPPIPSFSAIGLPFLLLGGLLACRWLIPALKRRLTFPRTGFVAYRKPSAGTRWILMGITGLVSGAVTVALAPAARAMLDWIPAMNGLMVGAFLVFMGFQTGLRRFHLLAGFSGLAGAAIFLAALGETLGCATYFAVMGLAVAASGALTLRLYLRRSPMPTEQ